MPVARAVAERGRRGGVILRLVSYPESLVEEWRRRGGRGSIERLVVLPVRGWTPTPGEEYLVDIVRVEARYLVAAPHVHRWSVASVRRRREAVIEGVGSGGVVSVRLVEREERTLSCECGERRYETRGRVVGVRRLPLEEIGRLLEEGWEVRPAKPVYSALLAPFTETLVEAPEEEFEELRPLAELVGLHAPYIVLARGMPEPLLEVHGRRVYRVGIRVNPETMWFRAVPPGESREAIAAAALAAAAWASRSYVERAEEMFSYRDEFIEALTAEPEGPVRHFTGVVTRIVVRVGGERQETLTVEVPLPVTVASVSAQLSGYRTVNVPAVVERVEYRYAPAEAWRMLREMLERGQLLEMGNVLEMRVSRSMGHEEWYEEPAFYWVSDREEKVRVERHLTIRLLLQPGAARRVASSERRAWATA